MQQITAIYENGVFRPLSPLDLAERCVVHLSVSSTRQESGMVSPAASEMSLADFDKQLDELAVGDIQVVGTHSRSDIYFDHD